MNVLNFTSPLPPSVNHYTKVRSIIKNGKPLATVYKTAEAKKYQKEFKNYVIKEIKKQNWNIPVNKTQHFYVDCIFYLDRIDKDPTNYDKCLLDAITETGTIWIDDNVACLRIQRIYYDNSNPRIEIQIKPVDYIGIFDNVSHLNEFENKCIRCKRYRNGKCSVLRKAIEGRIQKEISQDFICEMLNQKENNNGK